MGGPVHGPQVALRKEVAECGILAAPITPHVAHARASNTSSQKIANNS